jgi:hypothetical protein
MPLAVRAQQGDRVRRVAVLMLGDQSDPDQQSRVKAFRAELTRLGWFEDRYVRIDAYDHRVQGRDARGARNMGAAHRMDCDAAGCRWRALIAIGTNSLLFNNGILPVISVTTSQCLPNAS